jgi:hypothetical protein
MNKPILNIAELELQPRPPYSHPPALQHSAMRLAWG